MAVPSTIADLDTTASNNDPIGANAPSVLDDHLRALAAIVKQNVSKGADIASSSTITVPNSGGYFVVTGTTTINGINDCWNGRSVLLKFSGALTLTNSASLILFGSNITTAAGDTLFIVNESAGVWRAVAFTASTGGEAVTLSGTQTLTNKTLVAASNTITTAASGNLVATELNSALAELQGDIDTRSTTSHNHSGVYEPADATILKDADIGVSIPALSHTHGTTEIDDNAVTLAKMAHGTDGNLITYDATGAPAYVATGTATHVLTSNGAGAAPTFQAAAGAQVAIGHGTIAHGGTIPLPSGYTEGQCKWMVSPNYLGSANTSYYYEQNCSANGTRVVTCNVKLSGDPSPVVYNGTANYIIIGVK